MMTLANWCRGVVAGVGGGAGGVGPVAGAGSRGSVVAGCRSRAKLLCDHGGRLCADRCEQHCGTWNECGALCTKILLIIVNFVFLVCGVVLIGLGLLLYIDRESQIYSDLLHLLPSTGPLIVLEKIPAVFLAAGATVLLLSFLGCYGACVESVCLLWLYTILLFVILATEIIAVTCLAVFRDNILLRLETAMQRQITNEYNKTALPSNVTNATVLQVTSVWDTMQVKLNCCGAVGPQDYKYSAWFNHTKGGEGRFVPPTCCVLHNTDPRRPNIVDENACQIEAILHQQTYMFQDKSLPRIDSRVLKTRGCGDSALQRFAASTSALFCIIFALTILQVVHFLFACSLLTKLRRSLSDYQWYDDKIT